MRRYWKSVMLSVIIISISAIVVFTQKFSIGGNEFGSDAVLGLQLGLDLQGGSHLVYQSDLKVKGINSSGFNHFNLLKEILVKIMSL